MAFSDGTFTRVSKDANSDNFTLWSYYENATLAAIRAANYFNDAYDYGLRDGDIIMIQGSDGFGFSVMSYSDPNFTVGEGITSA